MWVTSAPANCTAPLVWNIITTATVQQPIGHAPQSFLTWLWLWHGWCVLISLCMLAGCIIPSDLSCAALAIGWVPACMPVTLALVLAVGGSGYLSPLNCALAVLPMSHFAYCAVARCQESVHCLSSLHQQCLLCLSFQLPCICTSAVQAY